MFEKFLSGNYKNLLNSIESGENISVFGLNLGEKLALTMDSAFLFYVVDSIDNINPVLDKLSALGRSCEVLTDPISPLTSEFACVTKTIEILNKIKNNQIDTLIITPEVMTGFFPKLEQITSIELKKSQDLNLSEFQKQLIQMNYKRVDLVSEPCEFSVRGDIIDIFPIGFKPTRISLDYDAIESIKIYNPVTMLTTTEIDSVNINTNAFVISDADKLGEIYDDLKLKHDNTYEDLQNNPRDFRHIAISKENYCHVFELKSGLIVFDGTKEIYSKLENSVKDYNESIKNLKYPLNVLLGLTKLDIKDLLKYGDSTLLAFQSISQANRLFNPQRVYSIRTLPSMNYFNFKDGLVLDVKNYIKSNFTVILCVGSEENSYKFKELFQKENINFEANKSMSLCLKGQINILEKNYPLDIILPEEKLAIISTTSLIGVKKKVENVKVDFFDGELPKAGDFVVHNFHGVGKCLGVETLKLSNALRDYVVIEYKNSDRLYLPVENVDQISKYLGSDKAPALNKIGGVEFAKTKSKVKSAVKKIAYDLIALYRERMNKKGVVYPVDDELQTSFENSFPYAETSDQLSAINDCKKDMEQGKIMDRLVCGDVGFGKTEVALRIAFKTIMSGRQVAFLCPTTILSEQHYSTAKSRFADFGVKVEVLNRLKSPSEVSSIIKSLKDGKIDMLIGTHKILGKDVEFKNLGLLILDEEQKFGVADKDKIKNMKKNVNVLTLSATPIPRTLNMSLIGVRDISVIETPPMQRIASDVKVLEYSDELVKKAIDFELGRHGQVLVIYNRVENIEKFASHIRSLSGGAVVSYAHGQMNSEELEHEIFKLYSNVTQILVATTLIENGVDLPNANTLIVINSDMLGLSQLYQLKGRIGRSDKQSFAYFTYDSRKMLTENGYKRLQAIEEFSGMGSGFKIAMRDLEIRGAGSLLGLEQSGHIEKIGYNLYVKLLSDSIKELNNEKVNYVSDVRVETNISAYLSHDYIDSSSARMKVYKEISNINTMEKFVEFLKNTKEIYGDMPEELVNLAKIGFIKNMCGVLHASKIVIKDNCNIVLDSKESLTKELVAGTVDEYSEYINFNFADLPTIIISNVPKGQMLDFLIAYLQFVTCNC